MYVPLKRFRKTGAFSLLGALLVCLIVAGVCVLGAPATRVSAATVCSVRNYGATGNGTTRDTTAIQNAINACSGGGKTVELTSGKYLSGPLTLPGNIIFQLDSGATLLASQNASDYPATSTGLAALITSSGTSNVTITGSGTIDGQGAPWWSIIKAEKAANETLSPRPPLISFNSASNVTIEHITLKNAPNQHITLSKVNTATITQITISSPSDSPNTDGIDVSASQYVHITSSTIDDGDDDVAITASGSTSSHDISVSSCTILHGHGLSIGSYTSGGVYNVSIHDNTLTNTSTGIRLKSARDRGGEVTGVTYTHLTMTNVSTPISLLEYYPKVPADGDPAQPITSTTPNFHGITISKVTATGASNVGQIIGLPERPMTGITLSNVNISAKTGLEVRNATVSTTSVTLTVTSGSTYILESNSHVS
ncbi:MAG TPA: glycosyl hydrolase family 28 protein [Ktedonobacteraceae bacterium]|nr:glycosyl hydrolase family 28 protein [Ktedonobacteraceae bacterium]